MSNTMCDLIVLGSLVFGIAILGIIGSLVLGITKDYIIPMIDITVGEVEQMRAPKEQEEINEQGSEGGRYERRD